MAEVATRAALVITECRELERKTTFKIVSDSLSTNAKDFANMRAKAAGLETDQHAIAIGVWYLRGVRSQMLTAKKRGAKGLTRLAGKHGAAIQQLVDRAVPIAKRLNAPEASWLTN